MAPVVNTAHWNSAAEAQLTSFYSRADQWAGIRTLVGLKPAHPTDAQTAEAQCF